EGLRRSVIPTDLRSSWPRFQHYLDLLPFRIWVVVNYAIIREIIWIVPSSVKDTDCGAAIIASNLACAALIHPNPLCASVNASLAKIFWFHPCNEVPCFEFSPKICLRL